MIRFAIGQTWEADFSGTTRQLRVEKIYDDGWRADFRFLDDGDTASGISRTQLTPEWRLVSLGVDIAH